MKLKLSFVDKHHCEDKYTSINSTYAEEGAVATKAQKVTLTSAGPSRHVILSRKLT